MRKTYSNIKYTNTFTTLHPLIFETTKIFRTIPMNFKGIILIKSTLSIDKTKAFKTELSENSPIRILGINDLASYLQQATQNLG